MWQVKFKMSKKWVVIPVILSFFPSYVWSAGLKGLELWIKNFQV